MTENETFFLIYLYLFSERERERERGKQFQAGSTVSKETDMHLGPINHEIMT